MVSLRSDGIDKADKINESPGVLFKYNISRNQSSKCIIPKRIHLVQISNEYQYNDIRQECGFKNVIIANRMSAESNTTELSPFVDSSEAKIFQKHKYPTYYWWVVLHELLGHGTGKLMCQESDGSFNFDVHNPPIHPINGKPISSWYKAGQTWTGQFGDLATTVDECRAELTGAYLLDDLELLELLGFNETTEITAGDSEYPK